MAFRLNDVSFNHALLRLITAGAYTAAQTGRLNRQKMSDLLQG